MMLLGLDQLGGGEFCAGRQQRVVLFGETRGGPQITRDADVAHQDAFVEIALPAGRASANSPNSTKFASLGITGNPCRTMLPTPGHARDQCGHAGQGVVGVPKRRPGGGLGDRRQVIGQPHQQHRLDDGGRGDQVAEPTAREREGLAHRPGDDQPGRVLLDQLHRAGLCGELAVGLVEDQIPAGIASRSLRRSSSGTLWPDGLFGLATNTMSGLRSVTAATRPKWPRSCAATLAKESATSSSSSTRSRSIRSGPSNPSCGTSTATDNSATGPC